MTPEFYPIVPNPKIRVDERGDGHYGTSRIGHIHQGVDIVVTPGMDIHSPIDGTISPREHYPYDDDHNYTGIEILGTGDYAGYSVKMFYVIPNRSLWGKEVQKGDVIAIAQNIAAKYGAPMIPHVHVEVRKSETVPQPELINPENLLVHE